MSDADASDYDKLKKALLTRYNYTEDGYRKRFREATPETEETPYQFVIRLKNYLAKWLELSGSSPDNFDALVDLIVKEQFINACSEDLAMCYRCRGFGHRQSECGTKISPGKDQKGSSTPVSQSSQKKTRAMVAQLNEDGEKAFTCVEVEGTRSKRNLKKSGTEGSTNSDRAVYSAVCRAQSNDGQTYVGVGKLNGRPVKVLRDTGCTGMIVDRALVPEVLVIPGSSGSLQMVDHTLIDVPLANVYLDSPYYKGHCRVMCVSSPVYPVIIGNVRGARRMLPDSDWKAEDQPGVRARTSGGNKDKDNDDNQGGDIPAWMFRRSNQKTEKSAPKERDSKKKPAQPKENDDRARRNLKVKEGATEEKCVAGPVVTRAQAKKSDKVHPLKVKEAMSSVDKSTIENLQNCVDNTYLSLIHLNIRSFQKNYSNFENYISALDFEFSIIGFSETWLTDSNKSFCSIVGYNHEYLYRQDKIGGGVSLFIKDNVKYFVRSDLSILNKHIEVIFVEIDKNQYQSSKNIVVGTLYRPPNTDIEIFNAHLNNILEILKSENKSVYIMGDYNINLLNVDSHNLSSEFLNLMYSFAFFPVINKPTRISKNTSSLIDNIFCNDIIENVLFNGILYTDISDHLPIFSIINKSKTKCDTDKFVHKRIYNSINNQKFCNMMERVDWNFVLSSVNCQQAFSAFYDKFKQCYESCFPKQKIRLGYHNRKIWLSKGLKNFHQNKE